MMGEPAALRLGSPVNPSGAVLTAIRTLPTSRGGQRPVGTR